MDVIQVVPKLEDLAFEVSYQEILSNLILCYDHRPEGKRLSWLPFSSVLNAKPAITSEKMRCLVRARLNQHLVGVMSEKIREKYVSRFYESVEEEEENIVDIWPFLDCVLDHHFEELEMYSCFPECSPSSNLIPTIAKWSPMVKKLTINFFGSNYEDDSKVTENLGPFIQSLSSLKQLEHLCLRGLLSFVQKFTVLGCIGKSCPSLSHLSVNGGDKMDKKVILALVLGELVFKLLDCKDSQLLPSWCEDEELEHLVIPSDLITPICSNLRELRLINDQGPVKFHNISGSTAVFILRHFPSLETIDWRVPTSLGVKKLYGTAEWMSREKFKLACQVVERSESAQLFFPRNLSAAFNGYLSLTKLDYVHVKSKEMLKAVGSLCPFLREVFFCREPYTGYSATYPPLGQPDTNVSPEEVKSILRGWPKVTTIGLKKISPRYIKAILEVFHPELKFLELTNCIKIKLADLAVCFELEGLKICFGCSFHSHEIDIFNTDTFLPKLKSFQSFICMGHRSRLFEEKSGLVNLVLHCSHIGMEVEREEQPRKRFKENRLSEWCQMSQCWSHLETLYIGQFAGLSMAEMSELIPLLRNLKEVTLPKRISSFDVILFQSIENELLSRVPPPKISFALYYRDAKCEIVERN